MAAIYLNEGGMGIEAIKFASGFRDLVKISKSKNTRKEDLDKAISNLQKAARSFYKDYQPSVDCEIMPVMLGEMSSNLCSAYLPAEMVKIKEDYGEDFTGYATTCIQYISLYRFLPLPEITCELQTL